MKDEKDTEDVLSLEEARSTKTILVEDISSLRKVLSFNLEIYTGTQVIAKYNADEVIKTIEKQWRRNND
jgi:hypothetical protein